MNKIAAVLVSLLLILIPLTLSYVVGGSSVIKDSSDVNYYKKGFRYNIQGWVYIHIEGEPYERGYQYGYLASAEIVDAIHRWSKLAHAIDFMKIFVIKNLPKNYDKLSEQWWDICRSRSMNIFLKQVPSEYQQEMKGIADGVRARGEKVFGRDIEFEDIVAANFVQDCMVSIKFFRNRFHPFHGIFNFNGVRGLLTSLKNNIGNLGEIFKNTQSTGHCSAFIATGDATSDGGIVVAQATHFNRLVAERCNIILDVQPSNGYRFIMTSVPGSLWSQEDYYQNEKGVVLTETELPQGPFKLRGTIPKGVRGRKAIQYSDDINDVIKYLQEGNNGLIPNEWLIGDTKTGEIASLEQALFNTPIKRTYNGFYSSYNAPHCKKVERELFGIISFFPSLSKLYSGAAGRDEKFKELEQQYYGKIDAEIAKKILATPPICLPTTDGKITTTKLMESTGFLAIMGCPNGSTLKTTNKSEKKFHGITELPSSGWVELYSSISKPNKLQRLVDYNDIKKTGKLLWKHEVDDENIDSSFNVVSEDIVYTSISQGEIYALDASKGDTIWNKKIGDKIVNHEVSNNLVIIGTDNGICAVDKETGAIKWERKVGEISSKPIVVKDVVIASCSNGDIYAFDIDSGVTKWNYELPYPGLISEGVGNTICIGANNICYCLNINDRKILWKFETAGKITASPRIDGNSVYFGSWDGNIYALDLSTGKLKWTFETGWGIDTTPVVSDGMVLLGANDNNFYALDEDNGEMTWYFTCKSAMHSSPVVYGEYVFFGCDDGRIYALNKTNGDLAWSYAPEYSIDNGDVNNYITTPILSDPVVENRVVYISAKGNVYALDAQTVETSAEKYSEKSDSNNDLLTLILYLLLLLLGIALLVRTYLKKIQQWAIR